jgi:hypothetical protein
MTTQRFTTRAMSYDNPVARRRQLSSGPFASNEICINWNAPLVYLAVGLEALSSPNGLPVQ